MNTRVYIDGYNLYYGCLKKSPYKWLDLKALFESQVLPSVYHENSSPQLTNQGIKFFTAKIVEKAALDSNSTKDQEIYHNALKKHLGDDLRLYEGYYAVNKVHAYQVQGSRLPRDCNRVEIWKLEEKQSDVNLATEALFDVVTQQDLEQIVYVSNDTDIAASMIKVRQYNDIRVAQGWKQVRIGLVIPTKSASDPSDEETRRANKTLSDLADWTVKHITNEWLEKSQLPHKIPNGRKPATIPISWHPESEMFALVMQELAKVHNLGQSWQWLTSVKPYVDGLIDLTSVTPLDALCSTEGAIGVYDHAKAYVGYKLSRANKAN
ncbi:NYN domain-containing protein [Vibrio anguillarum]|uniref:NYN domain-containing protein n=1 Tax=Vibrio anguillarum TaxID=55601 RepID=UPI00097E27F3|nr:NYN domain-containing protein [Vibrio anguillarum]MBT2966403.1 NYN domain-containing protein [Vibrio anguillarum]